MAYKVVLFYSTSAAIQAEKLLVKEGFCVKLIPVPRLLSSDCGVCLRFEGAVETQIKNLLDQKKVAYQGIYAI
ncbi:MAG: hypothetical protein STSR0004_16070 [Peptococcaceae bacterium]